MLEVIMNHHIIMAASTIINYSYVLLYFGLYFHLHLCRSWGKNSSSMSSMHGLPRS